MRRTLLLAALAACTRRLPTTADGHTGDSDTPGEPVEHAPVRVLTWNVETLGDPSSDEHQAVREVLRRLDADVVALNELVDFEEDALAELADALGYDFHLVPDDNPFGPMRNALLTRLPVVASRTWTSEDLSGDDRANDVTRWPLSVTVEVDGGTLALVGEHWQSGFYESDTFRRCVDAERVGQVADAVDADVVVVAGDVNAELDDGVGSPAAWTSIPSDVPSSFWLGADLYARMSDEGLPNDPFAPLRDRGLEVVDAAQRDGRTGTRDSSGRRLDYLFLGGDAEVLGAEVYDARDDGSGGLPKAGDPPPRDVTERAADHFPVFVDLRL